MNVTPQALLDKPLNEAALIVEGMVAEAMASVFNHGGQQAIEALGACLHAQQTVIGRLVEEVAP